MSEDVPKGILVKPRYAARTEKNAFDHNAKKDEKDRMQQSLLKSLDQAHSHSVDNCPEKDQAPKP